MKHHRRLPAAACNLPLLPVVLIVPPVLLTSAVQLRAQEVPLRLTLTMTYGGQVSGLVLDHSDRVVVLDYQQAPCAFAFDEAEVASAYRARKKLLSHARGGAERLNAEDHFQLGLYALSRHHPVLANIEFKTAVRLDRRYSEDVEAAREHHRQRLRERRLSDKSPKLNHRKLPNDQAVLPGLTETIEKAAEPSREQMIELYKEFGRSVGKKIELDLKLVETEHFLIWTDWEPHRRDTLGRWCEEMYAAVAATLGLAEGAEVFLGKCPVFCFRTKAGFLRFGRTYDGWTNANANGYSRTDSTGHTHLVIYRRGITRPQLDSFATTLVHEGTHAFVHRYAKTGNISGWIGEGFAEYVAQEVLGDRCHYAEAARLVARQYVLQDLPISTLLRAKGMPQAHEYPVAHSLVRFLVERDPAAFARVLVDLKNGHPVERALRRNYGGLTFKRLDAAWRKHVRTATPPPGTTP